MARRVLRRLALPAVLAVLAVGCGQPAAAPIGDAQPAAQQVETADDDKAVADINPASDAAGAAGGNGSAAPASGATGGSLAISVDPKKKTTGGDTGTATAAKTPGKGADAKAAPANDGVASAGEHDMDAVAVSASVAPTCVRPGGTITITIKTESQGGAAYNAFYSDGKSGAAPPYGEGYGGNNGGIADEGGTYTDTWTVAANAPTGPGRIDVVAGNSTGFGETKVAFAVADAVTGTCDQ